MNNKKTLTSLAAASMVITQAGQMSVFAKGATVDYQINCYKNI